MQNISIDETTLYNLIKRAVRDVLQEEMFRHRIDSLTFVSDEEMKEVEQTYGKPQGRKNIERTESLDV